MNEQLPSNVRLESELIGQTIVNKSLVSRELSTNDFYNHNHRAIWAACIELDEESREIDIFEVIDIARRNGLDSHYTVTELSQMTVGLIYGNRFDDYVGKLKNIAVRRFLMHELENHIAELSSGVTEIGDVVSSIESRFDRIRTELAPQKERFTSLNEILETEVRPALRDLEKGIVRKIKTGFDVLDSLIGGGLSRSDVVVVAADTGAGKSAFVLQTAINIAKNGVPVAFLSGEMTNLENGLRVVSQAARFFNLNAATHLDSPSVEYLEKWVDALKVLPIYFDSKTLDLQTLRSNLKSLVREKKIEVLVIDYLQLLKLEKLDKRKRFERISDASQEVKRIAQEFEIAVIEVVQYNREGGKSLKASIHDLEGSSQLEKDASLILLIDREEDSEEVEIRIAKGRNAGTSKISGRYQGAILNFDFGQLLKTEDQSN